MFSDEFDHADMNNPDDENGGGEGEVEVESQGQVQVEGSDLEINFPHTPIVGSNSSCASPSSRVKHVRDDEIRFYKVMKFKNNQELRNSLKIACLKKVFRLKKVINYHDVLSF
ncbi:hypothetical protein EJD97_013303 [Solanum chilense]|uniref:Uncharacterized protein n=1 Tax=Solanum chilense TaxID=4083 RepID=A0A6N2BC51_SOLCI|nr:hypothetical protein EJD97_013303 [Solanum chilense]